MDDPGSGNEYIFSFQVGNETFTGNSYSHLFEGDQGAKVSIEYLTSNPNVSRIYGTNNQPYGIGNFIAGIIFIMASLIGFSFSWKRLKKLERILRQAAIVKTFKAEAEATGTELNDSPLYQITYYYQVDTVPYTAYRYSTNSDLLNQMDEVVYAINNPGESILMSKVPLGIENRIKELNR